MSKLVLRFYSMSSAFQKKYLTASKTPYIFFYSTRSFMFSLVPVFATTHFYDAFKFLTALNKTSFKNIFAFCLLIGQLNNSFTYSRLLFTLSLHNSLDVLEGYYHIGLWSFWVELLFSCMHWWSIIKQQ